jgi:hypothetical protein
MMLTQLVIVEYWISPSYQAGPAAWTGVVVSAETPTGSKLEQRIERNTKNREIGWKNPYNPCSFMMFSLDRR